MTAQLSLVAPRTVDLATLPGVGLDDLLAVAALQTRIDRKYLVPASELATVLGATAAHLRILDICGRREFGYSSTYFDDPEHTSFHRAGRGRRRRFKVRTRLYRDSGETWLEVKTRSGRGETVKDRLPYDLADAGRLTAAARDFVAATLEDRGVTGVEISALEPVLRTTYRRATLLVIPRTDSNADLSEKVHADRVSRATVDSELSWRRPDVGTTLGLAGEVVVETKGAASPSPLDRALWCSGIRPSRVSKYGAGLAALTDLPDLKWHRVLDQHLRPDHPA